MDGGYGLRHLGAHLAGGGRWEELYLLVARGEERQPWAEARHTVEGNYAGYLADLDLAWRRAEEEGKNKPAAVGRQVRCALIESSIHSLAGNIPPELLAAAVEKKVLEPPAALAYARQVSDPGQRARALAALAPHWAEWAGREREAAYTPWPETLRALAARPRKHLLSDLRALVPILAALGGAEAAGEAFRAIRDVERWWP
ncbi:MAG: hypothetical protein ACP5OO_11900 [Chloroflexia bacterium]